MQIAFDTKNYDSQTEFTITNTGNGTGTYTAKYAGTYLITLSLQADIALGGGTGIYKNGSMIFLIPVTDAPSVRPFSRQIKLNAGDYIQIFTTLANSKKLYGSSATQQSNSIDIFRLGG